MCAYFRDHGASVIAYDSMAKHEFARNPYMREEARNHNRSELASSGVEIAVDHIAVAAGRQPSLEGAAERAALAVDRHKAPVAAAEGDLQHD